jgi:hypothetical protein
MGPGANFAAIRKSSTGIKLCVVVARGSAGLNPVGGSDRIFRLIPIEGMNRNLRRCGRLPRILQESRQAVNACLMFLV